MSFRATVWVALGAPASSTKITFFAVFFVVTGCDLISVAAGSFEASHEAVTPAPAISKNRRLEICGRLNPPAGCGHLQISRLNFSCWFMASSVVKYEIELVEQAPQQIFGVQPALPGATFHQ